MAFKPKSLPRSDSNTSSAPRIYPTPKSGSRKARVSLIVDLGIQEREDFEEADGTKKPQKPCQQVAVALDLVNDVVDYGGDIGEAQYRLYLNKYREGKLQGINFTASPPKDAQGNTVKGKPWTLHPTNVLTKIAKACGRPDVIESMDIEQLLDLPFLANVEVKESEDKNGKVDDKGKPVVYKNVNFRGATPVPNDEDDDGNEIPAKVAKLRQPARIVTFDSAKKEDIQFLRRDIIAKIKLAHDYAGSAMQRAIEAYEAENGGSAPSPSQEEQKPAVAPSKPTPVAPKKPVKQEDDDTEVAPF